MITIYHSITLSKNIFLISPKPIIINRRSCKVIEYCPNYHQNYLENSINDWKSKSNGKNQNDYTHNIADNIFNNSHSAYS